MIDETVEAAAEPGPLRFTRLSGAEAHIFESASYDVRLLGGPLVSNAVGESS